jgi:hypothetical protein
LLRTAKQNVMAEIDPTGIAAELDAMHRQAQECYRNKNVAGYMQLFTSDLRYKQADGRFIGKEQLARDVGSQLARVEAADSSYRRESLSLDNGLAVEQLTQTASVTVRHFFLFRRTWHVNRRGRYVWTKTSTGWRIRGVEVLQEQVSVARSRST